MGILKTKKELESLFSMAKLSKKAGDYKTFNFIWSYIYHLWLWDFLAEEVRLKLLYESDRMNSYRGAAGSIFLDSLVFEIEEDRIKLPLTFASQEVIVNFLIFSSYLPLENEEEEPFLLAGERRKEELKGEKDNIVSSSLPNAIKALGLKEEEVKTIKSYLS